MPRIGTGTAFRGCRPKVQDDSAQQESTGLDEAQCDEVDASPLIRVRRKAHKLSLKPMVITLGQSTVEMMHLMYRLRKRGGVKMVHMRCMPVMEDMISPNERGRDNHSGRLHFGCFNISRIILVKGCFLKHHRIWMFELIVMQIGQVARCQTVYCGIFYNYWWMPGVLENEETNHCK
ncbi:hypothetical protein CRG98_016001 [Punica granatum]|uniref:Uncharacterized protein n=1 Tax=Punica granatum TaxID=22663 RepID=A0A2I0K500_PUNGR|nr:hypothetical protein CRG98_016001 [Punica granatum]